MRVAQMRSGWRNALAAVVVAGATVVGGASGVGASTVAVATPQKVAGYLQNATGSVSVSAKFGVPYVNCPVGDAMLKGTAAGVAIFTNDGLQSSVVVQVICFLGTANYIAVITIDGAQAQYSDNFYGGTITASLTETGAVIHASIKDPSQSWHHALTGATPPATEVGVGSIGIVCASDGCFPEAQTLPTKFHSVSINGGNLAGATRSQLTAFDGSIEVRANALNAASDGFTTKWISTCGPQDANGRC